MRIAKYSEKETKRERNHVLATIGKNSQIETKTATLKNNSQTDPFAVAGFNLFNALIPDYHKAARTF